MKWLESGKVRLLLLLLIVALVVNISIWQQNRSTSTTTFRESVKEKDIPKEGIAEVDTKGQVLGNPQNGIADLKKLYPLIVQYRKLNPDSCQFFTRVNSRDRFIYKPDVRDSAMRSPEVFGFKNAGDVDDVFRNPDTRFGNEKQLPNLLRYLTPCERPDGTFVGTPKAPGTRDVLASTDIYFYENYRIHRSDKVTRNPVGFYLVLWDDGEVAEVPYYNMQYAKIGKQNSYARIFPGQAGTYSEVLDYDEYHKKVFRMVRGPRGKAGSQGEVLNDLLAKKP